MAVLSAGRVRRGEGCAGEASRAGTTRSSPVLRLGRRRARRTAGARAGGLALPPEFGRVGEPLATERELVVPGGVEAGEEGSDGLGDSDGPTDARGLADGVGAGAEGDGDEGDGDGGMATRVDWAAQTPGPSVRGSRLVGALRRRWSHHGRSPGPRQHHRDDHGGQPGGMLGHDSGHLMRWPWWSPSPVCADSLMPSQAAAGDHRPQRAPHLELPAWSASATSGTWNSATSMDSTTITAGMSKQRPQLGIVVRRGADVAEDLGDPVDVDARSPGSARRSRPARRATGSWSARCSRSV